MTHQKLHITRAVHATAFLLENFQNNWGWSSLNCKIFLKALVPRKGLVDGSCLLTNSLLIIQVKGSRELGNNLFQVFFIDKWCFHKFPSILFAKKGWDNRSNL